MVNIYSIKTKINLAVFIGSVILTSLLLSSFILTYMKFLKYEEDKINIYTTFLENSLDKQITACLHEFNVHTYQEIVNQDKFCTLVFENIIEPENYEWQVLITDNKGKLLHHSHKIIDGDNPESTDYRNYPSVMSALIGEWGINIVKINTDYYYTSSRFISSTGWIIIVQMPLKYVVNNVIKILLPTFFLFVLLFGIFIVLSFIWVHNFIKPVIVLTEALRKYGKAESYSTIETDKTKHESHKDEVDIAIDSYNKMIEDRKVLEIELMNIEEEERKEISEILHNNISKRLHDLKYRINGIANELSNKSELHKTLLTLVDQIDELELNTEKTAIDLCPSFLSDNSFFSAINDLTQTTVKNHNITCKFTRAEDVIVNNSTATINLFRIIQEAINYFVNTGVTKEIHISIVKKDMNIVTTIYGIGAGKFDGHSKEFKIIKYRAKLIESNLNIIYSPDDKTSIVCSLEIIKM